MKTQLRAIESKIKTIKTIDHEELYCESFEIKKNKSKVKNSKGRQDQEILHQVFKG
jgi:hypothetical protein